MLTEPIGPVMTNGSAGTAAPAGAVASAITAAHDASMASKVLTGLFMSFSQVDGTAVVASLGTAPHGSRGDA